MKFALRDLLWLTLLCGALLAWAIDAKKAVSDAIWHPLIRIDEGPTRGELERAAAAAIIAPMSNVELDSYFASLLPLEHPAYEVCLTEMARRGMAAELKGHYDALMAGGSSTYPFDFPDLELLTALRLAEGERDPLLVRISFVPLSAARWDAAPPLIRASIENIDRGGETPTMMFGGDGRGGRLERWRFVLTDEHGVEVADSNELFGVGGGLATVGPLQFGKQTREQDFDLRKYLAAPPSGRYTLQAFYHNSQDIAAQRDVTDLILVRSKPIPIIVTNYDVRPTREPWLDIPRPLAVLAACLVMTVLSAVMPRALSAEGSQQSNTGALPGIAKRDFLWGAALICLALAMWLTDASFSRRRLLPGVYPDATAKWTIRLADEGKP